MFVSYNAPADPLHKPAKLNQLHCDLYREVDNVFVTTLARQFPWTHARVRLLASELADNLVKYDQQARRITFKLNRIAGATKLQLKVSHTGIEYNDMAIDSKTQLIRGLVEKMNANYNITTSAAITDDLRVTLKIEIPLI